MEGKCANLLSRPTYADAYMVVPMKGSHAAACQGVAGRLAGRSQAGLSRSLRRLFLDSAGYTGGNSGEFSINDESWTWATVA